MDDQIMSPSYEDLADAWWKIKEALDDIQADFSEWKMDYLDRIFCELLEQCGWTVIEWNSEVDARVQNQNSIEF